MRRWINPNREVSRLLNITNNKIDAVFIPPEIEGDSEKEREYFEQSRGFTFKDEDIIHKQIIKIIFPEGLIGTKARNKYTDSKILALHILRKRDIFVTKDKDFIKNNTKEKLEKEFPTLKIRLLNEDLIEELKSISNLIS